MLTTRMYRTLPSHPHVTSSLRYAALHGSCLKHDHDTPFAVVRFIPRDYRVSC